MGPGGMYRAIGITVAAAVLGGCANPQTADEFRKSVPDSMTGKRVTFEASRPVSEIARTFQAKAPECLTVKPRRRPRRTAAESQAPRRTRQAPVCGRYPLSARPSAISVS